MIPFSRAVSYCVFIGLFVTVAGGCASTTHYEPLPHLPIASTAEFPTSWLGLWQGTLQINNAGGKTNEVHMGLNIDSTNDPDVFVWQIIYGENDGKQVRDYRLVAVDQAQGIWQIDERNSIVLDAHFYGDTLHSLYDVMGSRMLVMYRFHDLLDGAPGVEFELIFTSIESAHETGGKHDMPAVINQPIGGAQRAVLRRVH